MVEAMGNIVLLAVQIVVGGALLGGAGIAVWAVAMSRDIHPDDNGKPIYRQRLKVGSSYRPKSYAERWGIWLGLAVTLGPAMGAAVWGLLAH